MATWQQQLPSMQIGNSNAPGNQLPQVPQYQQQPTQGQQILGGLQSLAQTYAGIKQQEQQKQFQQAFGAAYASGDREALKRLAAQNPQQLETIQKAMGFVDADHKQAVADTSMQLQTAAALGPEAVAKVAAQNAPTLQRLGITPAGLLEAYQKDPAQVTKMADLIGMQSVGPEKYFDLKDRAATRDVTMRGQDISRENAQLQAQTSRANAQLQASVSRNNALTAAYAPTTAMKNYQQYMQLQQRDPEAAKAFAQSAGINPKARNLFKIDTLPDGQIVKYYSDGTEETGSINQKISAGNGVRPLSLPQAQKIIDGANEGTKKAAGFALRLNDSITAMRNLSKQIDPARAALISRSLGNGSIANMTLSPLEQQYMINANDAMMAILRPETGAAITAEEQQAYSRMYLPQPGDSPQALAEKQRKLEGQLKALKGQAGSAYDALVVSSRAGQAPVESQQAVTVGQIQQGQPATQQPATQQPVAQQAAGQQQQPIRQAPQQAVQLLLSNPGLAQAFQQKYGYLPQGFNQ